MRRAVLLALASLVAAGEPEVRLPKASEAKKPAGDAAVVSLTADGLIVVEEEGKPESLSLAKLTLWLCDRVARFEKKPRGSVKPSERPGEAGAPTEMPVVIRADENAPWLHVQRLLEACRQAGIRRLGFGVKGVLGEEGRLGPHAAATGVWEEFEGARLAVQIAVTREQTLVWGPMQAAIAAPLEMTFRMGGIEAREIDAVRRYLRDAGQTAAEGGYTIAGRIEPDAKVPFGTVVLVLNEYYRAGLPDVRFKFLEPAATAEELRAARLPYPR